MPETPTLVCFDLGGVLIRICRSWAEGCAAAGLPAEDRDHERVTLNGPLARVHQEHQLGRIDGGAFAELASRCLDGVYTPAEVTAVHDAWMLGEYEGVDTLIDRLHDRGVVTAALSNTNQEHWKRIPRFRAVQRLRHLFASHELGLTKPDAAIYRTLEERLGVRGPEIVFFDDLPENVAAARARGWQAEQVDPLRPTAPQIERTLTRLGLISPPRRVSS